MSSALHEKLIKIILCVFLICEDCWSLVFTAQVIYNDFYISLSHCASSLLC